MTRAIGFFELHARDTTSGRDGPSSAVLEPAMVGHFLTRTAHSAEGSCSPGTAHDSFALASRWPALPRTSAASALGT